MASRLTLTSKEQAELEEFKRTSLPEIQHEIRTRHIDYLVEYINWLLYTAFFPLDFFQTKRKIDADADKAKYIQLTEILDKVHRKYLQYKSDESVNLVVLKPVDLVLFMCGYEPVSVEQLPIRQMTPGIPLSPMLENTTPFHKKEDNFKELQQWGIDFLRILSEFGPFNAYLVEKYNDRNSRSQPFIIALMLSEGERYNLRFANMISSLFITDVERINTEFNMPQNSMYMTKLKTGRVMKLFGLSDHEVTSILSRFIGGRRTSRRKQTKSRNPRKRKSTKQRRRKSMKYRKS